MVSTDFDTALLGDFLSHLETERGNDARNPQYPLGRHPLVLPLRRLA